MLAGSFHQETNHVGTYWSSVGLGGRVQLRSGSAGWEELVVTIATSKAVCPELMQCSRRRSEHCFTSKSDPVSPTSLNEARKLCPVPRNTPTASSIKLKEMFIGWKITRGKCTMSHQHLLSFSWKLQTLKQQNTYRTAAPVAGWPDTDMQVRV